MEVFDNLGVAETNVKETYLAAFLACWLCKFVLPWGGVNLICPRVFKVASRMAQGETFRLVVLVLASILQQLKWNCLFFETWDYCIYFPYSLLIRMVRWIFQHPFHFSFLEPSPTNDLLRRRVFYLVFWWFASSSVDNVLQRRKVGPLGIAPQGVCALDW